MINTKHKVDFYSDATNLCIIPLLVKDEFRGVVVQMTHRIIISIPVFCVELSLTLSTFWKTLPKKLFNKYWTNK